MKLKYFKRINFEKIDRKVNVLNKILNPSNFESKVLARLEKDEEITYYKPKGEWKNAETDKKQFFNNAMIVIEQNEEGERKMKIIKKVKNR